MSENISVSVRIRPLNQREREADQKEAWRVLQGINIAPSEHNPRPGTQPFAFDNVFDGPCETISVYDRCAKSIMTSALEGQNGTIFVYGQTSSGKTHTMQGNEESPGIVPLGISYIFDEIKRRAANVDFLVRCSYVEIYNENITDLLTPKNGSLKLCTNAKGGCFVGGVTEPVIANAAQATELISKGMANRSVGETKMNSESSRSHSLLRLVIESRDKSDASGAVRIAELNLVDLAGSERQSHTQATGTRLKEVCVCVCIHVRLCGCGWSDTEPWQGANINKSLLTLSNVIAKLSEGAQGQHIPYRDSKLTRVLERALGGNSRTSIICTVTNAAVHAEETLSTLKVSLSLSLLSSPRLL
jgi:centromeric protein E